MKRLLFLTLFFFVLLQASSAQSHRAAIRRGHGAAKPQELAQAVFSAFQQNRFENMQQYLPDEVELRILKRRSSEDMRALLQVLNPDSIKQSLQREFKHISEQSTANAFNWQDWQLSDTRLSQRDAKNRMLYTVEVSVSDASGNTKYLVFEAIKVKTRFFLFRQIVFRHNQ